MVEVKCKGKWKRIQGKGEIGIHFRFGDQDTIEGVITFRIDSRTIKEGALVNDCGYHVPLGSLHCI